MPGPQPITPGEILAGLPSDGWNGFVEAYRRVMQGAGQPNGPGGSSGARRLTALVKNNTGAAIDVKFGVVELDGPLFNTDDRETVIHEGIAFKGIEPTTETKAKDVAIYQGPVGDAQSMEAVIIGPTWVRLELPEWDETYTTAKATDGDCTKLTAGSGSIPVLWHATPEEADPMADPPEEQETEVWALVMLGGGGGASTLRSFLVVTDAAGASTYTATGITGGTVGKGYLLDEDMAATSSDPEDKIEFKSLHFVGVPVGAIVEVSSTEEIVPGTTWDGADDTPINKVWGEIVSSPHELAQLTGFAEKKAIALPDGASTPQGLQWLGAECEE